MGSMRLSSVSNLRALSMVSGLWSADLITDSGSIPIATATGDKSSPSLLEWLALREDVTWLSEKTSEVVISCSCCFELIKLS